MKHRLFIIALAFISIQATCNMSFKDVSVPPEVKSIRVNYIENKARYINPQLSPQLTDKLRQKIISQTRLTIINNEDADYDVGGYISDFSVNTSGISGNQVSSNNLNVTVHLVFKNRLNSKKDFESDITRNFPFPGSMSFTDAQNNLMDEILKNVTEDIFNKIFSDW